jgi:hypothetical protein
MRVLSAVMAPAVSIFVLNTVPYSGSGAPAERLHGKNVPQYSNFERSLS